MCRTYEDAFRVIILRPPAVYGPRDGDILQMFRWIKHGLVPTMGPADKMLSLIYVVDLARAIVSVLQSGSAGSTYFVADRNPYFASELVNIAADLLGKKARNLRIPTPVVYSVAAITQAVSWFLPRPSIINIDKVRDLLAAHWTCSAEKIHRELGFATEVGPREGLARTLTWYRNQGWL